MDAVSGAEPVPASSDASFRRYFRLRKEDKSFIAMDAPPEQEECLPFVTIAGYLEAMQLAAPRVVEADLEKGFLLLTDLGSEQYLKRLQRRPALAESMYHDATDALLSMQKKGVAFQGLLPPYDEALLRFELSLFRDWLCGTHMEFLFSAADETHWQTCCDLLVANAILQPKVFVHRDYHSRNLMVLKQDNPGILDFQDAVEGPLTYDLVSLLKDCYVNWPANKVREWALNFYARLGEETRTLIDEKRFLRHFELMGVHRHLKAAGIFCRLRHRDGKAAYLADVPRTLEYILEIGPRYPELRFLTRLIDQQILPGWDADA
ncbi:MAG TPA: phosphotransferase [Woeseiaceae bacterium]|nr:phosphotransferase [Woeseiaceae bacterium]